jgi:threonine/homoserine/homoserine lactone efflux protein
MALGTLRLQPLLGSAPGCSSGLSPPLSGTMGLVWLTGYTLLVAKVGALLRRPSVRRAVNAVAGTVLTALGVRLAFERR